MTEVGIVALIGATATALVAVAGLIVNVVLANRSSSSAARQRRYEELMAAYSDVGRMLSAQNSITRKFLRAGAARETEETTSSEAEEWLAQIASEYPELKEDQHRRMSLELIGAGPAVLRAHQDWVDINNAFANAGEVPSPAVRDYLSRSDDAVLNFYRVAGADARAVLARG